MSEQTHYQVGGSISAATGSYIEREADNVLLSALKNRELCYVFNARQMGKSSLLLNVKSQLQTCGYQCCFVDMSRIGSVNITLEQWYGGMVSELWRGFSLPTGNAVFQWWESLGDISPPQKLAALFDKIIDESEQTAEFAIFFDEVDSILSLPFSADDFFSVIRACYNQRANQAKMKRLQFALFGVALPSDLMSDPQRSPFNIGRAIALQGFKLENAQPLAAGLEVAHLDKKKLLAQVLKWSKGQPFLTQKICRLIADTNANEQKLNEEDWLEKLLMSRIVEDWVRQDNPEHLRTIRDRMLLDENQATFNLDIYQQLLTSDNKRLSVDENIDYSRLQLTGLINIDDGHITIRSKIYQRVFDSNWLEKALANRRPYAEKLLFWQEAKSSSWLLSGDELAVANQWCKGKHLPEIDHQFIAASQAYENQQFQQWNQRLQQEIEQREIVELELKNTLNLLEQAKGEAESANQAKTDFLARVSHEVRTPINSVLGLSYLALQQPNNEKGHDYLTKIHRATNYMLGVVNDMVDISKLEKKELELCNEPFLIADVVNNIEELVGSRLLEKGLEFRTNLGNKNLPLVRGDAVRLQQLLLNLVTNALKHTEQGHIEIALENTDLVDDLFKVTFIVSDTGNGLSNQAIDVAVSSTQKPLFNIGLGLKLCSQLADLMTDITTSDNDIRKGLWVQSSPGKGCKFSFSVSFDIEENTSLTSENSNVASLISPAQTHQTRVNDKRILVVEDDEINQQIMKELLTTQSSIIDIVANGQLALNKLVDQRYDLVLMDIEMPVMGGIEAIQKIRELASKHQEQYANLIHLPVIAMTAHALVNDRQRFIEIGFNGHIAKPINPIKLSRLINDWLGQSNGIQPTSVNVTPTNLSISSHAEMENEDNFENLLTKISSINVSQGLERCAGNKSLYFKLLQRFSLEISDEKSLEQNNVQKLRQRLHFLKGTAGNLGISDISERAAELEAYCLAGEIPSNNVLETFQQLINTIAKQISSVQLTEALVDTSVEKPVEPKGNNPAKPRVLIVDSSSINLRTMSANLKSHYTILAATNLEKAQQIVQQSTNLSAVLVNEAFTLYEHEKNAVAQEEIKQWLELNNVRFFIIAETPSGDNQVKTSLSVEQFKDLLLIK